MSVGHAVAVATIFLWLGMVIAISFVEAPLKFRAPGVTLRIGLGIGRLVFRALNAIEIFLAVVLVVAGAVGRLSAAVLAVVAVAIAALGIQLLGIRPLLNRRSDAVLSIPASSESSVYPGRSRVHYGYVVLEVVKVIALVVSGVVLLAGSP